eukprot:scaffold33830_cov143-Skeletonema_menzelii.AAC.1
MILKFSLYSAAGVALLSNTATDAFVPSKATTRTFQLRSSPGGGDGPSPEFLRKMGLSEDANINELQQSRAAGPPPAMSPLGPAGQMQQPPQQQAAAAVPPPPQQQQFYDANGNPVSMPMVYDANGNLVPYYPPPPPPQQQPMQQQQQPARAQPINAGPSMEPVAWEPPLPNNPKTSGGDPRPVGYNADSYAVSNTADVYFAQLKQDSRVRKRAWLSGDKETANQVFTDPSVKQIRDGWVDNPYTKEKNIQEARAEIEGAVRMQLGGNDDASAKSSSGVSYKQKLAEMKARRGGGGVAVQQPPSEPQQVVSKPPPPVQVAPPAPKVQQPVAPKMQQPPPAAPVVQPSAVKQQPPAPVQDVTPPPPVAAPTRAQAATEQALPGALSEDEKRRELRTLQGLLLKQRGGPGFGAGRLREAEASRLEKSLETVMSILRSEDGDFIAGTPTAAAAVATSPPVAQAPKPVQPAQPVKPAQPMQPTKPVQPAQPVQPTPAPVQSQIDPMTGSIACVEAALKMYQDASPAERQVMMIPLREALMAAASGANKVIAETELKAHKAAMEAGPPEVPTIQQAAPAMGFPTTYAVTKPDERAEAPVDADNLTKLNNVYDALTNAQGSGKLGLKNLSGNEAGALVKQVESMRGILLDELNN